MKLSRSKIELFVECPRCFYLDQVHRISRPPGFPFSLNNAVDELLKKEFDYYRSRKMSHPLQIQSAPDFIPADDVRMDQWRNSLRGGVSYVHPEHNCTYFGGIDDLWVNDKDEYAVVDYKATAADQPVNTLPTWAGGYARQLAFYAWLLQQNGLTVLNTGYIVYATASKNRDRFDNKLDFDIHVLPIALDHTWITPTLDNIQQTLASGNIPPTNQNCKYCSYMEKGMNYLR
jgi:CRISPR/Cas system-associated exonuclease Cas4 (RecB family)